jgi:hypothetical protein
VPVPDDLISLREALHIVTRVRGLDHDLWIDALVAGDVRTWRVGAGTRVRRADAESWHPGAGP